MTSPLYPGLRELITAAGPCVVGSVSDPAVLANLRGDECDAVELRLDLPGLHGCTSEQLLQLRPPMPVLLTFRHETEGGGAGGVGNTERVQVVRELLPMAAAVDWEVRQLNGVAALSEAMRQCCVPLIASAHFFEPAPPDIDYWEHLEQIAWVNSADVFKVAFTPRRRQDAEAGLHWLCDRKHPMPQALMGMGPWARESRMLYTRHGSCLLYGYLGNSPTAPGQMSTEECLVLRRSLFDR